MMKRLEDLSARIFPSEPSLGKIGSIEFNVWLAQLTGIPIMGLKNESLGLRIGLLLYGALMISVVTIAYTGFEIYDITLCWNNLDELTQNISLSLTHVAGIFKTVNMFYRLKDIRKSIKRLQFVTKEYVITEKQRAAFFRGEFENKIPLTIYATLVGFTGLLGMVLLFNNPESLAGKSFPYRVQMPLWMPYELQLVYMGISAFVFALQIVSIDYINVTLMNQIRFQLKILNLSFDELTFDDIDSGALEKKSTSILLESEKRMNSIIEHHCSLIGIRKDVEAIFQAPVLIQFFTSLVIFALTGFQAITMRDNTDNKGIIIIYFYCGCISCELFFYCWFGNDVSEQSKTLATSAYTASWYKLNQSFKKSLIIFMTNAQRPFVFTAGGFMALSLPSFAGILSKSYSYIAVLRQIYSR